MIGLGILTYNRPQYFKQCLEHILKNIHSIDFLCIYNDGSDSKYEKAYKKAYNLLKAKKPSFYQIFNRMENKGIATAKNTLLKEMMLMGCEHLFLMDDDILLLDDQALTEYIRVAEDYGYHHLLFSHHGKANKDRLIYADSELEYFPYPLHAFTYYTKDSLQKVGVFDERFYNSWEGVEHTKRLGDESLAPLFGSFPDLINSQRFIQEIEGSDTHSTVQTNGWRQRMIKEKELLELPKDFGLEIYESGKPWVFATNHNNILDEVIPRLNLIPEVSQMERTQVLLLWQDILGPNLAAAELAKANGIPVVVVEHGLHAVADYLSPRNHPLIADVICVWGQDSKDKLISAGIDESRIKVVGCPLFNRLKPRLDHKEINVVFVPYHMQGDTIENKEIYEILSDIPGINVVAKINEDHNASYYPKNVFSNRRQPNHLDVIADLLTTADVVVSTTEGTFELLAYKLDIPVLAVDHWTPKKIEQGLQVDKALMTREACQVTDLANLRIALGQEIAYPWEMADKRAAYIKKYADALGNPVDNILKVVDDIYQRPK